MPRKGSLRPNTYRIEGNLVYLEVSLGQEAILDKGDLQKVLQYRWYAIRRDDIDTYYVVTHNRTNGSVMYLHRYIMDAPKGRVIDHWNHNGLDNRRKNIRVVTQGKNRENVRWTSKNSNTGILGLSGPMTKKKQGGKYTYHIYRFRCECPSCPVYKEFPATEQGIEAAKLYAKEHHAVRIAGTLQQVQPVPEDSSTGIRGLSAPIAKQRQGGKYTYYYYRFRCKRKACPAYKEFPATVEGLEAARAFAKAHYAAMKK